MSFLIGCCRPTPALQPFAITQLAEGCLRAQHTAGLETSVTRTPLASTLILSILAGSSTILVPCLASALVALYITLDFPFITSQRDRSDMALKARITLSYLTHSCPCT